MKSQISLKYAYSKCSKYNVLEDHLFQFEVLVFNSLREPSEHAGTAATHCCGQTAGVPRETNNQGRAGLEKTRDGDGMTVD